MSVVHDENQVHSGTSMAAHSRWSDPCNERESGDRSVMATCEVGFGKWCFVRMFEGALFQV